MNSKMQPIWILPSSPIFEFSYSDWDESANISGKFSNDLRKKLKINFQMNLAMEENLRNEGGEEKEQLVHEDSEYKTKDKEEEEFSFSCTNLDVSMVSAEEMFINGKIRAMLPIIADGYDSGSPLSSPLRKLFIQQPEICPASLVTTESEDLSKAPHGRYSKWPQKLAVDASPEKSKKSNSKRFSKCWRFLELLHRRKCDRKDASVFLNPPASGGSQIKMASSATEKYYLNNRAKKENEKRRSYLPYKLGFFTDANGMSRKVHSF